MSATNEKLFKKILVANRSEIAIRVMNACRTLGIPSVAVYSDADANSKHRLVADESVHIGPPPPRESYLDIEKIITNVEYLRSKGVDVVNIPDGPRASLRMSPIALASIIESRTKMETMLHYTCRDRNLLGMQSDLLGGYAGGLRILDVSDPTDPRFVNYFDTGGYSHEVFVDGNIAYLADGATGVQVIFAMNNIR